MSDPAFADNPWSAEHWNLTRQGAYIKKYGLEVAKTKAKQAGTKIGAPKPTVPIAEIRNFIMIKKIPDTSPPSIQGTSGSGPPTT